ncbi:MAG: hypothetical protein RIC16_12460 [Rhodospirillales bacterium]
MILEGRKKLKTLDKSGFRALFDVDRKRRLFLYGAGTGASSYSRITLAAVRDLGLEAEAFLDDDQTKRGTEIDGVRVDVPDALTTFDPDEVVVVISSNYIDSMVDTLSRLNRVRHVFSCDKILSWASKAAYRGIMDYREVLRRIQTHEEKLLGKFETAQPTLNILDVQITERCSMKCVDCSNLMQYYEAPVDVETEILLDAFSKLASCVGSIEEVRVLGGEPFMKRDIDVILDAITSQDCVRRVAVLTNATIVPRENVLNSLRNPKIFVDITDYDELSRNHDKLVQVFEDTGIDYIDHKPQDWTDSARIVKNDLSDDELATSFSRCCVNDVLTLLHGRLYHCPFSANAYNLKAIPPDDGDVLEIGHCATTEELTDALKAFYFGKPFLEACRYCLGRDFTQDRVVPGIQTKSPVPLPKY